MEYIFVSSKHRQSDPKKINYESSTKYYNRMKDEHGLIYEPCSPFKKDDYSLRCFKVNDQIKALEFVFKYSDFIEKPET